MSRDCMAKILDMVEEGMLDAKASLAAALNWMSEAEVSEFADHMGWVEPEPPEHHGQHDQHYGCAECREYLNDQKGPPEFDHEED